jgi:hypothetical protein
MIEPANTTSYEVRGTEKSCCEILTGCCDRGGCCRQIPSKIICDQDGQVIRVNLMFYPTRCFKQSEGIVDNIPEELLKAGLTLDEVDEWFVRKLKNVGRKRNPCCWDACSCIGAFAFFCFLPCACKRWRTYIENWNHDLIEWQVEFNEQVLSKKNMFVKTQSNCEVSYDKNGKHRHIERWISIAVTADEVQRLKSEPHLYGDIENWGCCGGVDEDQLCMHP